MWVAIALLVAMAIVSATRDDHSGRTLDYLNKGEMIVIRSTASTHRFPVLGIEVGSPQGWSYLSVENDATAAQPTFVNEAEMVIVKFVPFRIVNWSADQQEGKKRQYGDVTIEWFVVDHRQLGRFTQAEVDVAILVINHSEDADINESIGSLCSSIRVLE